MSTTTTPIRNGYDSWVESGAKHPGDRRLRLKDTTQFGFLYLPLGQQLRNRTIVSSYLHLWGVGTGWGSQTLTVRRADASWDPSTLTWNTKPGVTGATATKTQTNPADPTEWVVDVTALVSEYAAGARWFGFRLAIGDTTERKFRSLDAVGKTPYLTVTWTDAPAAPVDLHPSGDVVVGISHPVLSWSNANSPDGTTITDFQVHIEPAP